MTGPLDPAELPAEAPPGPGPVPPVQVPISVPMEASLRQRLRATRDRLVHEAATNLIRLGQELPGLKKAGYWLYGTATLVIPRGKEVKKLGALGDTVLRGAQPSLRGFKTLKEMGVDTIINLRPESDHERGLVGRLGMKYVYLPLPPLGAPTHEVTLAFLEGVTDPANGLVFFHCYHGVDRTGTMAACLRIARDGWTVDEALAEMRAYKVHEHGQRSKLAYVADFAAHWASLPADRRRAVLHLPEPEVPVVAEPPGLVARARTWLAAKLGAWLGRGAAEASAPDQSSR